jgi:uncharacterized radical SAM superfamily Fe-S cluster-containing enzyme
VSFTGRDEDISEERRRAQRYTLTHLAHDLESQLGATKAMRDWFPLSAMNPFSDVVDNLMGERSEFGALKCGCHPNCGIGTILLVNKITKQMTPVSEFLNVERLLVDFQKIADARFGKQKTLALMALALVKNFDPAKAPPGYGLVEFTRQALSQMGAKGDGVGASEGDATDFAWRFLFVAGMWFQDLFNYDFRRTEMCIIPYGTQMGEISFCAYNTGVGWRQIVEKIHHTAKVSDWFREHGRHPVYAKHQSLPLDGNPVTAASPPPPREPNRHDVVVRVEPGGRRRLRLVS